MATKKTSTDSFARKTTRTKVEAPMIVKPKTEQPVATSAARTQAQPVQPTYQAIEKRAYEIFAKRGYAHGHDQQDWLQAEAELRRR